MYGFHRIAAAAPRLKVGDPGYNAGQIIALHGEARLAGADAVVFPEHAITGATCGDMLFDQTLQAAAAAARERITAATVGSKTLLFIGVTPLSAFSLQPSAFSLQPSAFTIICDNSPEFVGSADARRRRVTERSGLVVLVNPGVHESTSNSVHAGHCLIARDGKILAESERFKRDGSLIIADVDAPPTRHCEGIPEAIQSGNRRFHSLDWIASSASLPRNDEEVPHPFIPSDLAELSTIAAIQSAGLAKRLEHTNARRLVIGVSGGLDSALALLVCADTCDLLGLPRSTILAVTMPGLGTTRRTKSNAAKLANLIGAELRVIPIKRATLLHFKDIGHDPAKHDIVYENAQARERTQILFNLANAENGLVVGTGDLSEIALGWCTYGGDHLSSYNVNCSVPKTLARAMVSHRATLAEPKISKVLREIVDTPVSPELLPGSQCTEAVLGRYEYHDFFLYHYMKTGATRATLQALAEKTFGAESSAEISFALSVFFRRFITQQFKRAAMPDGPRIHHFSLPRFPSDLSPTLWI